MTAQFARAAHLSGRTSATGPNAPHAALLIDFDNVTMGIRSDLTKELKNLLNSDIIKGKVAVQRAYADWRRYPQYIVPLAENSVDLIFAPAYGTSKKNATDIRLSIDALELVFTRPEIGTFILLSGDSDFSSLVLKLKEYGKYVIGVGIRESASDLLVQNCDEYYSYSALTGLTRASDEEVTPLDPWENAEIAVQRMAENNDVMRSDRLKQVMLELDPNFDEKALGFTKFNRFLHEAATRGLLSLKKLDNGQFEVAPFAGAVPVEVEPAQATVPQPEAEAAGEESEREPRRSRRTRGRERARTPDVEATTSPAAVAPEAVVPPAEAPAAQAGNGLTGAYDLLRRAMRDVTHGKGVARDSDVKRRILEIDPDWSESAFGFTKFSRFLRQAHDAEVINLRKLENGNYELALPGAESAPAENGGRERTERGGRHGRERDRERGRGRERGGRSREDKPHGEQLSIAAGSGTGEVREALAAPERAAPAAVAAETPAPAPTPAPAQRATPSALFRRVARKGPAPMGPPPLLEGQTVAPVRSTPAPEPASESTAEPADHGATIKRLTALKGVGQKTAEAAVAAFGPGVLDVVRNDPERVRTELGTRRAQPLIDAVTVEKSTASPRKGGRKATSKRARPRQSAAKK